jgi:hypothetical protein
MQLGIFFNFGIIDVFMVHYTKIISLLVIVLTFTGCRKSEMQDEYYIKYQVESTTVYYGGKLNVVISNESGSLPLIIPQRENWETTIGPVKKGHVASLNVTKSGWDGQTSETQLRLYLRILVSKNNSPFALKQINGSETPRATASATYTLE